MVSDMPYSTSQDVEVEVSTQSEQCPSSSTSTIMTSIISIVITALLATVVFVLVQIAICKCCSKSTPGGVIERGTSAGGDIEEQVYEQVDGGRGGVAASDWKLEQEIIEGTLLYSRRMKLMPFMLNSYTLHIN